MKIRFSVMATLSLVVLTQPASAQTAMVSRPDTLGANFDSSHPGTGTPADWDFLVGRWKFKYQQRNAETGAFGPIRDGDWTGMKIESGTLFQDDFTVNNANGPSLTVTYRAFDAVKKRWGIQGVAVKRGVWQPGEGWSDGDTRYLVQDNPGNGIRLRMKYYQITHDHFLWRADGSRDNGMTWMRDVILIEATRVDR
jgi:hypothetical protein